MENLDIKDIYLKKYIKKTCSSNLESCTEIVSTNGLNAFAKLWEENKEDLMLMIAGVEYEFVAKEVFGTSDLAVLRHALGNVVMFFKGCSEEKSRAEAMRVRDK